MFLAYHGFMTAEKERKDLPQVLRRSLPWSALALVMFVAGAALGWSLLGTPVQRLDKSQFVFDQPVQLMHNQMHYRMMSGSVATPVTGAQPTAAVPMAFHDFGRVNTTQVASWSFEISNTGDADLRISSGYTTCGCTTAELSTAVIPPGKSGLVTIQFDPRQIPSGSVVRRGAILETNDPQKPQVELWIQASVSQ